MKRIVSRLGNVALPSNLRKLSIRGARTAGIVSGYCYVMELIDLMRR